MNKVYRIALTVIVSTFVLTVLSCLLLPDTVKIMHSTVMNVASTLSKPIAIILADALCICGVVGILISKKEEPQKYNTLIIALIGIIWFVYMLLVNCIG